MKLIYKIGKEIINFRELYKKIQKFEKFTYIY